ncbi:MAG TPA: efflux RND transporter periplasmic adaptor subunit [Orrella sp.]
MRKWVGWLIAVVLVVAFAAVEWRPWALFASDPAAKIQAQTQASTQQLSQPTAQLSEEMANAERGVVVSAPAAPIQTPVASENPDSRADLGPTIRAELTPVRYTTLAAEINAKIQNLPVKEGQAFEAGAALVVFDCVVQKAQLARVRAELEIAQRNAQTNERLLKLGNISRVEAQNALSEAARAQAQVDELSAIVSKCEISAPYSGKVAEQRARVEQFVQVGQPVLEILDDSGLELEFIAPSSWAPWLKPGHTFSIVIDETGKTYPAKVTRVAARIDSVSQTFKVVAQIDGEFTDLTPGMSGTITVNRP